MRPGSVLPKDKESLGSIHKLRGVDCPCQLFRKVTPWNFRDSASSTPSSCVSILGLWPPEVKDQFFGFWSVVDQVIVIAPQQQMSHFMSVVVLILVGNQANNCVFLFY